jgi:phosphoglycerate kinase
MAKFVPAVAGFLLEREIKIMGEAIAKPKRPLTIILGGKKVAEKIGLIDNLLKVADNILIGGGAAYTFVKAAGGEIGNSFVDDNYLEYCRGVVKTAHEKKVNLVVGFDCVAGDTFSNDANTRVFETKNVREGWEGMDIGPETIKAFKSVIAKSGTIIWCGPLGVTEFDKFSVGSREVGEAIAATEAVSIAGGGDTAFTVAKLGLAEKFTHISTGGGASLELLEGKILPGVAALLDIDKIV